MAQTYLGSTALNQVWFGNTQINGVKGPSPVPTNGLLSYYIPGADGGYSTGVINDLSGNGNNLTLSGSFSYTSGIVRISGSQDTASFAKSVSSFSSLQSSDPVFTALFFLRPDGNTNYGNHWYLGASSFVNGKVAYHADTNFPSLQSDKIIVANSNAAGQSGGVLANTNTATLGNAISYYNYGDDFTAFGFSKNVTSSFSGNTWNGSIYARNYRTNGVDTTNDTFTNRIENTAITGAIPYIIATDTARAFSVDWSSTAPSLYIGQNPSQTNYNTNIDFAGAFIYNRLLTQGEMNAIYDYVNGITPLT